MTTHEWYCPLFAAMITPPSMNPIMFAAVTPVGSQRRDMIDRKQNAAGLRSKDAIGCNRKRP
jgi:hypothetical protein